MQQEKASKIDYGIAGWFFLSITLVSVLVFVVGGVAGDPDTMCAAIILIPLFTGLTTVCAYIDYAKGRRKKTQAEGDRYCVSCGRSIPFDAIFCQYCGHDYRLK